MQASHVLNTAALAEERRELTERLLPFAVFGIALLVMLAIRAVGLKLLANRIKGRTSFIGALVEAIRTPSWLWAFAAAIDISIRYTDWPEKWIGRADKTIEAVLIMSITIAIASLAVRYITMHGEARGIPFAAAGLFRALVQGIIFVVGVALVLVKLEMWTSVTPLLTALGVSGLAVALALQDTMANFFAGIHILIENPIALGDYIKLQSGEEGSVVDIGWRTTRIRTGANNTIVIPNKTITSGILTNYALPIPRVATEVTIIAGLDANPDQIAAIALDAASETEGVLADPAPNVVFDPGVTPTYIQMKMAVQVARQQDAGGIVSEIRVRILQKFREQGVPLPSPQTIVINS